MKQSSEQDDILRAAVDAYPLSPLPDGFIDGVMARVGEEGQFWAMPAFKLDFLDVALPAFLALLALLSWLAGNWLVGQFEAGGIGGGQPGWSLLRQAAPWIALAAAALVAELALVTMVGVRLWADRPFLTGS